MHRIIQILSNNWCVNIFGEEGIGKTTLAK